MFRKENGLEESKANLCPDKQYGLSFDSVQALLYRCQDSYCIELIKFTLVKSRVRAGRDPTEPKSWLEGDKTDVEFVNETVGTLLSVDCFAPED
jgi:hypothetical protein